MHYRRRAQHEERKINIHGHLILSN